MLMGEYHHNIDDKNRLIIPSKFREELGNEFVITRGLDGCLFVYSMDEWNKVISVNQTGIFLLNKYVINEMLKGGKGAVVNTSSMYGLVGSTTSFAYSASKGAINQMTRSLALTYARDNIRVNAIAPGYVDTPILSMVPDNVKKAMGNDLPIGRLGKDTEIANLICYLLSDDASFITGAIIPIDGGFTAK